MSILEIFNVIIGCSFVTIACILLCEIFGKFDFRL